MPPASGALLRPWVVRLHSIKEKVRQGIVQVQRGGAPFEGQQIGADTFGRVLGDGERGDLAL